MKHNDIQDKDMTDHYCAISQNINPALVKYGLNPSKIDLVYSGFDPLRFANGTTAQVADLRCELGFGDNDRVVLNAAHLSKEKGQDVLLRALAIMRPKYPDLRLVFAGGGDASVLQQLAVELGIADKVVFAGFRHDVGVFYNLCDVFTLPSLNEGLGTSVLDAMALKKPVVFSNAGGLSEIVTDGVSGRVVPVGDAEGLAEALAACFDNVTLNREMAEQGYARLMANFTLDKMVAENLVVYEKFLKF